MITRAIKPGGKRGAGDEEEDNGEGTVEGPAAKNSTTLTTVSTVPATTDQFMFTNNFKRLLVGFIMGYTLMTLRLATKAWKRVVERVHRRGRGERRDDGSRWE